MSEFAAALIGALVGGAATFCATWWQTKRVLAHERELARTAADEQRRATRHGVDQDAARELLPWLSELENAVSDIFRGVPANGVMDEMRQLQHSKVALLSSPGAREAWAQLRTLVSELPAAIWTWVKEDGLDTLVLSEGWTEQNVARSKADVEAFIGYMRSHLLAIIDESTPPPRVLDLPVLRRQDMSVWRPPANRRD